MIKNRINKNMHQFILNIFSFAYLEIIFAALFTNLNLIPRVICLNTLLICYMYVYHKYKT